MVWDELQLIWLHEPLCHEVGLEKTKKGLRYTHRANTRAQTKTCVLEYILFLRCVVTSFSFVVKED